jgi:hypothetical protein
MITVISLTFSIISIFINWSLIVKMSLQMKHFDVNDNDYTDSFCSVFVLYGREKYLFEMNREKFAVS